MSDAPSPLAGALVGSEEWQVYFVIRRWQEWLAVSGRANANTRRQYRNIVHDYCSRLTTDPEWVGERDPLLATVDDCALYLRDIEPKGGHRNQAIKALRSFYGYLHVRELVPRNPMGTITVRKDRRQRKPPNLLDAELQMVFAAAERIDPRARPGLELTYATGARLGSIVGVRPEDVHLDALEPWIWFAVAKNDDPYDVPLGQLGRRACEQLLELIDYVPKNAGHRRPTLLGVGEGQFSNWVRWSGERSGVRTWTHLLRHAFAYRVLNDPRIPPIVGASLLNHKNTANVMVYAAGDEQLKRVAVSVIDGADFGSPDRRT